MVWQFSVANHHHFSSSFCVFIGVHIMHIVVVIIFIVLLWFRLSNTSFSSIFAINRGFDISFSFSVIFL